MNSRERLLTALNHQEPDKIPLDLGSGHACKFTKYFYVKLLDYFGLKEDNLEIAQKPYQLVYASDKVMDLLGCDVRNARVKYQKDFVSPYAREWADENYTYYTNDFGTTYRMPVKQSLYYDVYQTALGDAEDEEEDAKFIWPCPNKVVPGSKKELEDYRAQGFLTTTCQVFGNGFLQTGPLVYGYENWLAMLVAEPERCQAFVEKLYEKKLEWYGYMFEEYGGLLDVTAEADDFGTQRGTFCSPKVLRELIFPYHKKLNAFIKKEQPGIKTTIHTCGSVYHIIPDLIEAGYDVLNPVQIAAANMEAPRLKKEVGKDITFWGGGINTQATLPNGTPEQVREETKRLIDAFAPGGGFVFATVHNVQDDVPIENFIAMWETFQKNCKY
jgi:uroporphyrinogen decarboxylase